MLNDLNNETTRKTVALAGSIVRGGTGSTSYIYDLTLETLSHDTVCDEVDTYFGFRRIEVSGGRVMLNHKVAKPGADVKPGDQISIRFGEHLGLYEVVSIAETVRKDQASSMYRVISEDESAEAERNLE